MYSYEDRIRAVKLYLKLGKRTSPTIRQLGYRVFGLDHLGVAKPRPDGVPGHARLSANLFT